MRLRYFGLILALILVVGQTAFSQESDDSDSSVSKKSENSSIGFSASGESIDIKSLIDEISVDTQEDAFAGYFYRMEFTKRKKGFFGVGKLVKKFEVLLPSEMPKKVLYKHPLILTYDSNKKLTQTDIINNRKDIIEQLEKIESSPNENPNKLKPKENDGGYLTLRAGSNEEGEKYLMVDLLKLIKNSEFSNVKELTYNQRDTISVDFRPIPKRKFADNLFYLKQIEGVILIDKKDKRIVEVKAYPLGKISEYQKAPAEKQKDFIVFHYLQTRVPEGFWFPKVVTLNFLKFPKMFEKRNVKLNFEFKDYKRFVAGVESVKVESKEEENTTDGEDSTNKKSKTKPKEDSDNRD